MIRLLLGIFCLLAVSGLEASARNTAEVRAAAYYPQGKRFREVYGNVSANYQFKSSYALNHNFELWLQADYLTRSKKQHCCKSRIQLFTPSLGLQYVHSLSSQLDGYLGTGVSLSVVNLKNRSCCDREERTKCAWGSLSTLGLRYWVDGNLFLDLFVNYLYSEAHFRRNVNLGGFQTGAGLGVSF